MKKTVSFYLEQELKKFQSPAVKSFALQSWYNKMFPYIPMETGILAENVEIMDDGLHFKSPQAHYLYEGILYVSPTTGSSWAKSGETKVATTKPLNMSHEQHPLACAHWGEVAAALHGEAISREIKSYILAKRSE